MSTAARATRKPIPRFTTDAEAERFVETADLSEYDLSGFKCVSFVFDGQDAEIRMRVRPPLIEAAKA